MPQRLTWWCSNPSMRGADDMPHNDTRPVVPRSPPQVALNFVGMDDPQRTHCCNHVGKSSTAPLHPQETRNEGNAPPLAGRRLGACATRPGHRNNRSGSSNVSVWARHLDGRLSGEHHDAHGNCERPTALAGADRHRASAVVHALASSALGMRSGDSEPARRSTAAQRLGGEPVVSPRWRASIDAGAARRVCC